MPSAAALFRTETVGVEYFKHPDRYMEWTALAFRLAADGRKIIFLDDLTFNIADTPGSLSKTLPYSMEAPDTLRRMLEIPVPREVKRVWERKYGACLHDLAEYHLFQGERRLAWKAHLGSLFRAGGLRYVLYTRYLFVGLRAVGVEK